MEKKSPAVWEKITFTETSNSVSTFMMSVAGKEKNRDYSLYVISEKIICLNLVLPETNPIFIPQNSHFDERNLFKYFILLPVIVTINSNSDCHRRSPDNTTQTMVKNSVVRIAGDGSL